MEISIKWNVCRVCLQEENSGKGGASGALQMRQIFNDAKLARQIYDCSGVLMEPGDSLPEKICKRCLTILKYAVNFRTTCRNTDDYLQSVIQKTKSATSLFKLDKRREETMELVDVAIDDIFEYDEKDAESEAQGDAINEKRKRITSKLLSQQLQETKKKKIDSSFEGKEATDQKDLTKVSNEAKQGDVDDTKSSKPETEILLEDIVGESADDSEEDHEEDEVNDEDENVLTEETVKKETCFEDGYIDEDVDEEEEVHERSSKSYTIDLEDSEVKPLLVETIEDYNNDEALSHNVETEGNQEEFFYIISDDVKREYNDNEVPETVDYIEIEDESKSENNTVENVEYLLEEESSQPLESSGTESKTCIESVATSTTSISRSKQRSYQRKGGGEMRVFVCDICGNHFTNRNLLNFHMKIHRNEKNFECELCFKRFNAACNLTAHMRIHTGEKPFQCQYCNRRFSDRSTHIKHERIHTNERPYVCTVCNKAFSLSTSLRAHEKIHTGEKPFRCVPCSKSFKLPHQLKAHLNTHLHKMLAVEQ